MSDTAHPERLLLAMLGAALVVVGAAWAFLAFTVAADQEQVIVAAVAVAAVPALLIMAVRPDALVMGLAAALVANAGLVLNEQFGVPSVVRGLAVVGLFLVLVRPGLRERLLRLGAVFVALLVFAGLRLVTTAVAPRPAALSGLAQELAYGILIVALLALAGTRPGWARRVTLTVVGTTAGLAVLSLLRAEGLIQDAFGFAEFQSLTPDLELIVRRSLVEIDVTQRIGGPVAEPNFWAQMLVFTVPLALWATRHGPRWRRIAGGVAAALIVATIFQTSSRGGLLALGVALVVLMVLAGGRARRLAVLVPVVLVAALWVTGGLDRFEEVGALTDVAASDDTALRGRASENIAALQMFQDHPLTGIGADNYGVAYLDYSRAVGLDARLQPRESHNSYLENFAESGLLGGLAFMALFALAVAAPIRARRTLLARERLPDADLAGAVAAGFAGYATAAVFLHQGFPEYTWLALGISAMAANLPGAVRPGSG